MHPEHFGLLSCIWPPCDSRRPPQRGVTLPRSYHGGRAGPRFALARCGFAEFLWPSGRPTLA
jgi:hypothetical protein